MREAGELLGHAVTPIETIMIGDSDVDVLTAKSCGAHSLGCGFGLAPERLRAAGPEITVSAAHEWPEAIARLAGA